MKARIVNFDNSERIVDLSIKHQNNRMVVALSKDLIDNNVNYVDFAYDFFNAPIGAEGYFVTDMLNIGTALTKFLPRDEEMERVGPCSFTACYGWKKEVGGILGIVTGMRCDFGQVLCLKDGTYYLYPRFNIEGDLPYEDFCVEYIELENGDYSDMARTYRQYMLDECGCIPLKERVERDARLKKAADSICIRVRQGWKPVPSPVEEQTPETEPEMHVACTFDRVGEIADEFKRQEVSDIEFCLVGWNYGGHDGRFPQIFPADPRLGGDEKMKQLIQKIHSLGYGIVCHDDATAAYRIADCFDEEYLLKNKDGANHARPYCWGGGRPYKICPQREYELFELSNQEKLAELGFEGVHYIDVITILPLLKCYDERHPLNRRQSADWYIKIMKLSREKFGGFSSESSFDFGAAFTDYVMYPSFDLGKPHNQKLCDEIIPFWHIVYHGIIMYNPCTFTLNYMAKNTNNRLKFFEYGGRPLACFYANFATNNHWMGNEDFICDTDEQMVASVSAIKQMSDDYKMLENERYEFIYSHEKVSDGVYKTTYTNGTEVIVDYNAQTFDIIRKNNQ